jgi:hypothetical protein
MKMKTYNVNFYYTIVVEAEDENEAEENGFDDFVENPPRPKDFAIEAEERID